MKDEVDGRLWTAAHEQFSGAVDETLRGASARASRISAAVPTPLKLMAVVLAVSVSTLLLAVPASAAEPIAEGQTRSVYVVHRDLNLTREADLAELQQRVRRAAAGICQPAINRSNIEQAQRRDCYARAVAGAREEVSRVAAEARQQRSAALVP